MYIPSLFCNGLGVDDSLRLHSKQENAAVSKIVDKQRYNQAL